MGRQIFNENGGVISFLKHHISCDLLLLPQFFSIFWLVEIQHVVLQKVYFVANRDCVRVSKCGQPAVAKINGALDLDLDRLHPEHDFCFPLFLAVSYLKLQILKLIDLLGTVARLGLEGTGEGFDG